MKLKLVIVDFEIPKSVKLWALRAGVPLAILAVGGLAYASLPHTFVAGELLTSADLNSDFLALDQRLGALESGVPGVALRASGTVGEQTSTTQSVVLSGPGSYLVSVALYGDHQDERQTYVVSAPLNGNINIDFKNLIGDSYVWAPQASISLATENGGGGWQANASANFTLEITYTGGAASATWSYSAVRIL